MAEMNCAQLGDRNLETRQAGSGERHNDGADQNVTAALPKLPAPIKNANGNAKNDEQENIKRGLVRAIQFQHQAPPSGCMRHYVTRKKMVRKWDDGHNLTI